jgi:hypothetical protein
MAIDPTVPRVGSRPHRWLALGGVLALILGLSAGLVLDHPRSASAADLAILQCNGVSNVGGLTVQCDVVVVNTLTGDPGTTGSVVTLNGGSPVASNDLVTSVDQCNGSGSGGGGTVNCTVTITNNISIGAPSPALAATVNECNDNQDTDGLSNAPNTCNPFPASTSGATITQCNGTGNGGGLVNVEPLYSHCTASGTVSASLPVTVNQCNGSANGGGSQVHCTVSMTTNVVDTDVTIPPTTAPGGTTAPTTAPGGTTAPTTAPGGTTAPTTAPGGTSPTTGVLGGTSPTTAASGATPTTVAAEVVPLTPVAETPETAPPAPSIDLTLGETPRFTG